MRHAAVVFSVAFGIGFTALPPRAHAAVERVERAAEAEQLLRNLNFFAEGGGMHVSPGMIELAPDSKKIMGSRWGIVHDGKKLAGVFTERYRGMKVGVLGCVACHSGRAAGQYIVGLGNKNIDVQQVGSDVLLAEKAWKKSLSHLRLNRDYREVEDSAMSFARLLARKEYGNLTQGMVPTSMIRAWFYRSNGKSLPEQMNRGAVKVPSFWGYGEKRRVGQFCDGLGDGVQPGWGLAVELTAFQKPEVVRTLMSKAEEVESKIGALLPPKYPFQINSSLAERGKRTFDMSCARCHGTYENDPAGLPVYKKPEYLPWSAVQTDRDRLDGNTPEFFSLVRNSPLSDVIRATEKGQGYFAPRLHGIWARFPYLHNGSVPNIAALLSAPEDRPKFFSLEDAGERGRFDADRLGLSVPNRGSAAFQKLAKRAQAGSRKVYFTERVGHSAQGHSFYTTLSEAEKKEIIEYLKTL